jgi:hypothetical protein
VWNPHGRPDDYAAGQNYDVTYRNCVLKIGEGCNWPRIVSSGVYFDK